MQNILNLREEENGMLVYGTDLFREWRMDSLLLLFLTSGSKWKGERVCVVQGNDDDAKRKVSYLTKELLLAE